MQELPYMIKNILDNLFDIINLKINGNLNNISNNLGCFFDTLKFHDSLCLIQCEKIN